MVSFKLTVFQFVFLLIFALIVHGQSSNTQVVKVEVRYKSDIILYCGDGEQPAQKNHRGKKKKENNNDHEDNDDDDDDEDGDGEDDDDNGENENKEDLWKEVQFFRALPRSPNASATEPGPPFELIEYDGRKYIFNANRNTLIIHFPKRTDVESSYSCNSSSPEKTIFFEFQMKPYLYMPESESYSHFEGEEQEFNCKALFGFEGGEALEWKWKYGKNVLQTNASKTVVEKNKTETSLLVKNLTEADAGDYKCIVSNKYGSHSRTIKLRIKDRLGFVWPLIGVVIILVLVLLIIFITELVKKAKEKKQRSD